MNFEEAMEELNFTEKHGPICAPAIPKPDIRVGDTIVWGHIHWDEELEPRNIAGIVIKDWSEAHDDNGILTGKLPIEVYDAERANLGDPNPIVEISYSFLLAYKWFTVIRDGRYTRYTLTHTKKNGYRLVAQ